MSVVLGAISWYDQDPLRLQRDKEEVAHCAPGLGFLEASPLLPHAGWKGRIPSWPFERQRPKNLDRWIPEGGLQVEIHYTAAYPMTPPQIIPVSPEPELVERSQAVWHVLPDGGLCLFQSAGQWQPEASLSDLLLKAAGWRLEYALMKHGRIERMSESGIVSAPEYDHFLDSAP